MDLCVTCGTTKDLCTCCNSVEGPGGHTTCTTAVEGGIGASGVQPIGINGHEPDKTIVTTVTTITPCDVCTQSPCLCGGSSY
jgi:hypothetical protein